MKKIVNISPLQSDKLMMNNTKVVHEMVMIPSIIGSGEYGIRCLKNKSILTYNGLRIVGTAGLPVDAEHLVLEILESHTFPVENLITHEYNHDQIVEAFEMASNAKEALKVVIKY